MNRTRAPRSRVRASRLWDEALAGLMQRPGRSLLTSFGTVLAVGSFVAVLGVTATANGQIQAQFNSQLATQVSVQLSENGNWGADGPVFPADAEANADGVRGVLGAGVSWNVGNIVPIHASRLAPGIDPRPSSQFSVFAATPGMWKISKPSLVSGRVFDNSLASDQVAVIGINVAESLGIDGASEQAVLFLNGIRFTVIGIFSQSAGLSAPLSSITIPADVAKRNFGDPANNATMTVQTRVGAAQVVASQLAVAIDPAYPDNFTAVSPPTSRTLQNQVTRSLQDLLLVLAALFLLVGGVGIANSSFTAALARIPEIGLKRSLGALPWHVGLQFLIEFTVIGAFGGMLGAFLGTSVVLIASAIAHWTPIISPWTVVAAPFLGAIIGLLASLYSAMRATRIEPIEAFRR